MRQTAPFSDNRRAAVLDAVAAEGGFCARIRNRRIAEERVDHAWLIHEGVSGQTLAGSG